MKLTKKQAIENLKKQTPITCRETDGLGRTLATEIYFAGEQMKKYTRFQGGSDITPENIDMKQAKNYIRDAETVSISDCPDGWQF